MPSLCVACSCAATVPPSWRPTRPHSPRYAHLPIAPLFSILHASPTPVFFLCHVRPSLYPLRLLTACVPFCVLFVRRRRCCTSVRGCGRRRPPSTSRSRPSHRPHASWGRSRCPSCTRNTQRCGSNEHLHTLPLSPAVPDMLISWCVRSEIKLPLSLFFSLSLLLTPSLCISSS